MPICHVAMASLRGEKPVKPMNLALGDYHNAGKGVVGAAGKLGTHIKEPR